MRGAKFVNLVNRSKEFQIFLTLLRKEAEEKKIAATGSAEYGKVVCRATELPHRTFFVANESGGPCCIEKEACMCTGTALRSLTEVGRYYLWKHRSHPFDKFNIPGRPK